MAGSSLPIDTAGLELGRPKLDVSLPGPLPMDPISTGRAPEAAPAASPAGPDINGMLNYQPTTQDRWAAFFHGVGGGDAAGYLNKLRDQRFQEGKALLEYQIRFAEFLQRGTQQQMAGFQTFLTGLQTVAGNLATTDPEQVELAIKGLERGADEGGIGWAKALVRPMLQRPDFAQMFPDLVPFIRQPAAQVVGLRLPALLKEGKAEPVLWSAALPQIDAQLRQRLTELGPLVKGKPFAEVVSALAGGNQALANYLNGSLPDDVLKVVGGARDSLLASLTQQGVELPSTTAKAQESAATTKATEQAKVDVQTEPGNVAKTAAAAATKEKATKMAAASPEVAAAEAAAAATKAAATEKAKLAPEIVALEAKRQAAITTATEQAKTRFDVQKPLTATEAGAMRGQFLTQSKDFADTIRAYQRVEDSVRAPSAAGDLALIFNYMKMLDPGSAVREGEQALAANARGVPDTVRSLYNRLLSGERLAPEQRQDFLTRSRMLVKGQLAQHEQMEAEFKRIAGKRKGDPTEVVPDLVGGLRKVIKEAKEPVPGRAATRAEVDAAKREAKGNPKRAVEILRSKGIDPTLEVAK